MFIPDDWLKIIMLIAGGCMLLCTFYAWYVKHMLQAAGPASFPNPSHYTPPSLPSCPSQPSQPSTIPNPIPRYPPVTLETYLRLIVFALEQSDTTPHTFVVPADYLEALHAFFMEDCEAGRLKLTHA